MDIRKYEALVRSIELGSFSAAGIELGYTAAGISHMVTTVEDELGIPIVKRSYSGVTLTNCGKKVYDDIRSIVRQENLLKQQAKSITGLVTGNLIVGSYFSVASHWLPKIFSKFLQDYPGVNLQLREGGHQLMNQWMEESVIDFCIYSYDNSTNYKWYPLYDDRIVVVVPPNHKFANRKSINLAECLNEPFIMPGFGKDYDILNLLKEDYTKLNIKFSTVENYATLSMVESGLGICIMNELITKGLDFNVKLIDFDPPQYMPLGIAVPSTQSLSPAAKKLISYIRRMI